MRFRRIEFVAIALTLAFVCFMGGYFVGARGSVNIVTVEPQHSEPVQISSTGMPPSANVSTQPEAPPENSPTAVTASNILPADPTPPETSDDAPIGNPRGGDGRININLASRSELTDLPGIGEVLAGRIVDYRTQYGAFTSIEQIKNVSGIGEKRFEAIRDKITVGN